MKTILITGAGGGISRAIIPLLYKQGYRLLLTTKSSINSLTSFLSEESIDAEVFAADLCDQKQVDVLFDWVNDLGGADVLINNAGVAHAAPAWKLTVEQMHDLFETNFYSAVRCTQKVLTHMREQNFGRIICVSSVVAHKPSFGTSGYAASKSALEGYVRGVAIDTASKGVTANTIAYGYMKAGMLNDVPQPMLDEILTTIPSGHFGAAAQIASYVELLINSPYTTGQTLHVNGGQWMP